AGSDIALESADIVLMRSDLKQVVLAIQLSRSVLKNIRQNLFWAFFYNILGIPLAAGAFYTLSGWTLSPMVAAAAMSFSSVTVVLNALRLRRFKPTLKLPAAKQRGIHSQKFNEKKSSLMEKKILSIEGMSCAHCSTRVEKALNALDGVEARVSLNDKKAYVTTNSQVSNDTLKKAVIMAGYDVVEIEEASF
ncbi:MAG: metal-transporting ATPase, partial [Bacteroidota bacterium]|nr:metal-transporting ATPase [Bacteroidota bacterium]